MSSQAPSPEAPEPAWNRAVRSELDAILASPVFCRSQRLSRFLRFIVETTLEGRADTLKEQVLAYELYGKGTTFDGSTDPTVRVDARRLRDKLREYYSEPKASSVVISLPKGTYVPIIQANGAHPIVGDPAAAERRQPKNRVGPRARVWRWSIAAVTLAAVFV